MEASEPVAKPVLNVRTVNYNQWNSKEYQDLKKSKNMNKSLRGSEIIKDVIANLQVRGFYNNDGDYNFNDEGESNHNRVFQRSYGRAFKQHLEDNKPNLRNLLDMRRNDKYIEFLEIRGRMVDWMIEVLSHYHDKNGSNEYTYFKAVLYLDTLISRKLVNEDNIHILGIACMYLASNMLDRHGIDLKSAEIDMAHGAFDANRILKYVNKAIEALEFDFIIPSWIEYLDKVIFDTFGDYRDNLAEFNIRQNAIFVLHSCAFDVQFYGWDPFKLAVTALMYSVNSFFNQYELRCTAKKEHLELLRAQTSKENIVNHVLLHSKMSHLQVLQNLKEFNKYLEELMVRVKDSTYIQLKGLFNYAE